jgi:hypothetical protein
MDDNDIQAIDRLLKQKPEHKKKKLDNNDDSGDELSQHTVNKNEEKENLEEIESLLKGENKEIHKKNEEDQPRQSTLQKGLDTSNKRASNSVANLLSEVDREINNNASSDGDGIRKESSKSFKKLDVNDSEAKDEYVEGEFLNDEEVIKVIDQLIGKQ